MVPLFMYSVAPMADQTTFTSSSRRAAVYNYLRPVVAGRRVLEIGCGNGDAAALLLRLGAKQVIASGSAQDVAGAKARHREAGLVFATLGSGAIEAGFDLVVVPEAADVLRGRGAVTLSGLRALIGSPGWLACIVGNGDKGEGLPYFDVVDALTPHFSKVRMFGQTPFHAYGIAEFDEAASAELRLESDLVEAQPEPSHYIALAGPDAPLSLGYALVQVPFSLGLPSPPPPPPAKPHDRADDKVHDKANDPGVAVLRQKLVECEGRAEGLLRVTRAQGEEMEELRARLRRTAEARAELDEEVRRLRRSLVEADESVVNLTRKTTEEMTALAQRLTAGLRGDSPVASPALVDELRRREAELAQRESALSERDDRIATLEIAKQEALWRADTAEDELVRARAELADMRSGTEAPVLRPEATAEAESRLKAQEATIDEFRRAAAAHLDEVNRLRDAANEQASLVAELEDELRRCEKHLSEKAGEAAQLQKMLTELEDEERVRRSRLAELEGLMLRAERASTQQNESRSRDRAELEDARARLRACQGETEALRARLGEAERTVSEAALAIRGDQRVVELEAEIKAYRDRDHRLAELRADAPDPEEVYERLFDLETQYQAATMAAARVPELEAKIADLERRIGEAK